MIDHKQFYNEIRDYRKVLKKELHIRENQLQKDRETGFYSRQYLAERQSEITAYQQAFVPSLKEEIDRQREKYAEALEDAFSLSKGRLSLPVSDMIERAKYVVPTKGDIEGALKLCKTEFDVRCMERMALDNGYMIAGLTSPEAYLSKFDSFCKAVTYVPEGDNAAPAFTNDLAYEASEEIYHSLDNDTDLVVERVPSTWEAASADVAEDLARQRKEKDEEVNNANDNKVRSAFLKGAEIEDDGNERNLIKADAKASVAVMKLQRELEAVAQGQAEAVAQGQAEASIAE